MPSVTIHIEGLDKLKAAMLSSPKVIEDELNRGIKRSVVTLERTARQLAPVDTGRLRASHTSDFSNLRGELYPTTEYAVYVHEGTKAHFPPIGTPGVGNWSKKHGIPAYKVALGISKKGTKARPWLQQTADKEQKNIENIMQDAVDKALNRIFK